ncbi:MAG: DUF2807 domain-containing protein, partial [Actinomycetia bacterium]|nr:DUF2807 domain-containing protein [Actinomycetes bacterium]
KKTTGKKKAVKKEPVQAPVEDAKPEVKEVVKEIRNQHKKSRRLNFGRLFFGLFIILISLLLLADTLDLIDVSIDIYDLWRLWPLILTFIGLSMLSTRNWVSAIIGTVITIFALILVAFFLLTQASLDNGSDSDFPFIPSLNRLIGSGNIVSEFREVRDFDEISLSGTGNIFITQGDEESLEIEADDNIIPKIITEVKNGKLTIRYKSGSFWFLSLAPTKPVNFYIALKEVDNISISGSGKVQSSGLEVGKLKLYIGGSGNMDLNLIADEINSQIIGSGRYNLSGYTKRHEITISGLGSYYAENLVSNDCKIRISGSGKAKVRVEDDLGVTINGNGSVDYYGDPRVDQNISGSGKVRKAD